MNTVLHALIELLGATMFVLMAGKLRLVVSRGVGAVWLACVSSAIIDMQHAVVPLFSEAAREGWMPLTWELSGLLRALLMIAALVAFDPIRAGDSEGLALPLFGLMLSGVWLWMLGLDHPWIYAGGMRPYDLVIAVLFAVAAVLSVQRRLVPALACWGYASAHAIIGFSSSTSDTNFLVAHAVKLSATLVWTSSVSELAAASAVPSNVP